MAKNKSQADKLFDDWWQNDGRTIDPDVAEVSWYDKRKELAGVAFYQGMIAAGWRHTEAAEEIKGNGQKFRVLKWMRNQYRDFTVLEYTKTAIAGRGDVHTYRILIEIGEKYAGIGASLLMKQATFTDTDGVEYAVAIIGVSDELKAEGTIQVTFLML